MADQQRNQQSDQQNRSQQSSEESRRREEEQRDQARRETQGSRERRDESFRDDEPGGMGSSDREREPSGHEPAAIANDTGLGRDREPRHFSGDRNVDDPGRQADIERDLGRAGEDDTGGPNRRNR